MRGHIIKRYKNSYTIVLNLGVDPITGRRKQQWLSVKGTKKEAEKQVFNKAGEQTKEGLEQIYGEGIIEALNEARKGRKSVS